ncbi:Hypothetical predicted protein [Mytilus galloprovincialis]|uniref:Tyr recombinase domain-containing protein n=1 Tax=Mytilus galloprovincialis TaxID=29158 RepID=A0A8B6C6A9_MYTGA|nr:Hypothetical predicted protein [Mytilus galloprovincialis]
MYLSGGFIALLFARQTCSRGTALFCHFDGKPLTKYQFSAILKKSLHALGIDNARWSSHSFRIGMATACAIEGLSDEKIKSLGRWKSGAYLRYIRTPV